MSGPAEGRRPHEQPIAPDVRALLQRLRAGEGTLAGIAGHDTTPPGDPRARRRELYILLAVCLDQVIEDFVSAPPADMVPQLPQYPGPPAEWASAALCQLLLETFDSFFASPPTRWRSDAEPFGIAPLLERIDACGPGVSVVVDRPRSRYSEHLIRAGMTTMAAVAPPVLAAAAQAASRRGGDPVQGAVDLAERSSRIVTQLAALGLEEAGRLQRELIDQETMEFRHADAVRLSGGADGDRLELSRRLPAPPVARRWPSPQGYEHRIGCPSLVRTGSVSPLEQMWTWSVRAARSSGYFAVRLGRERAG